MLDPASKMHPLKEHTSASRAVDLAEKSIFLREKSCAEPIQFSLLWSISS